MDYPKDPPKADFLLRSDHLPANHSALFSDPALPIFPKQQNFLPEYRYRSRQSYLPVYHQQHSLLSRYLRLKNLPDLFPVFSAHSLSHPLCHGSAYLLQHIPRFLPSLSHLQIPRLLPMRQRMPELHFHHHPEPADPVPQQAYSLLLQSLPAVPWHNPGHGFLPADFVQHLYFLYLTLKKSAVLMQEPEFLLCQPSLPEYRLLSFFSCYHPFLYFLLSFFCRKKARYSRCIPLSKNVAESASHTKKAAVPPVNRQTQQPPKLQF